MSLVSVCSCAGCHDDQAAVIEHPEHGRRVVCEDHAAGHEVIDDV